MLISLLYATTVGWQSKLGWLIDHDPQTQQDARDAYNNKNKNRAGKNKMPADDSVAVSQGHKLLKRKLQKETEEVRNKYLKPYDIAHLKKASASVVGTQTSSAGGNAELSSLNTQKKNLEKQLEELKKQTKEER